MIDTYLTDVGETKVAALLYLLSIFCDEQEEFPSNSFAKFCAITARTEDLVSALELAEADEDACQRWAISSEQWLVGAQQALYLRLVEALHSESARGDFKIPIFAVSGTSGQC